MADIPTQSYPKHQCLEHGWRKDSSESIVTASEIFRLGAEGTVIRIIIHRRPRWRETRRQKSDQERILEPTHVSTEEGKRFYVFRMMMPNLSCLTKVMNDDRVSRNITAVDFISGDNPTYPLITHSLRGLFVLLGEVLQVALGEWRLCTSNGNQPQHKTTPNCTLVRL